MEDSKKFSWFNSLVLMCSLFFRPSYFFTRVSEINSKVILVLAIWIVGFNDSVQGDFDFLKIRIFLDCTSWEYVLINLIQGLLFGFVGWLIFGEIFNAFIRYSRAENFNENLGRSVFIFSSLAYAIPSLPAAFFKINLILKDYYLFPESFVLTVFQVVNLVLCCWGAYISYLGVITCFSVDKNRAYIFFFVLHAICKFSIYLFY